MFISILKEADGEKELVWLYMLVIPAVRRKRLEVQKFGVILA